MKASEKLIIGIAAWVAFGISQTSFAGAQKVIVNNGASNPVPVTVQSGVSTTAADNPAFHSYAVSNLHNAVTSNFDLMNFDVPAGKIFVIETITLQIEPPSDQEPNDMAVNIKTGGIFHEHQLTVTRTRTDNPAQWSLTQPVHFYADGGAGTVQFISGRGPATTGTFTVRASASGYLVDAPAN